MLLVSFGFSAGVAVGRRLIGSFGVFPLPLPSPDTSLPVTPGEEVKLKLPPVDPAELEKEERSEVGEEVGGGLGAGGEGEEWREGGESWC